MGVNVERGNWGESDVILRCETLHWKGSLDGATQYMPVGVGGGRAYRPILAGCWVGGMQVAVADNCSIEMRALGQAAQLRSCVAFQGLTFLI